VRITTAELYSAINFFLANHMSSFPWYSDTINTQRFSDMHSYIEEIFIIWGQAWETFQQKYKLVLIYIWGGSMYMLMYALLAWFSYCYNSNICTHKMNLHANFKFCFNIWVKWFCFCFVKKKNTWNTWVQAWKLNKW
jgi:hypothetical protein